MKKELKDKLFPLIPFFLSLFIIIASVVLFYYIKGYRFNFGTQELSSTGILTIESSPSKSNLYIDGELYGKTPKNLSLPGGEYNIKIEKEGYYSWEKKVTVEEGSSTPIFPWLISEDTEIENAFSSSGIFDNEHLYKNSDSVFFTLYTDSDNTRSYKIYKLSAKLSAWDFTDNPQMVLSFEVEIDSEYSFDLTISPDSSKFLFTLSSEESKQRYIISANRENSLDNLTPITLNGFSEYSITWNKSNDSLLLESDNDILSYDINTDIKYLIVKKNPDTLYSFTTDSTGLIYLMEGTQEENLYKYKLSQYKEEGTLQKELISNVYFFIDESYIQEYRESQEEISLPFTNSQESTKTSGKVISFTVFDDIDSMFIQTEYACYWYDLDSLKFMLISPYSTSEISVSPLENMIFFKNEKEVGVFTFAAEEGNPNDYVGERNIWGSNLLTISNTNWISNGKKILFDLNSEIYVSDTDGSNLSKVYDSNKPVFLISGNDPSTLFVAYSTEDEVFFIDQLSIH